MRLSRAEHEDPRPRSVGAGRDFVAALLLPKADRRNDGGGEADRCKVQVGGVI